MTDDQLKELWKWAVHNRCFELQQHLREIRSTFMTLADGHLVHDKFTIAERQLRVVELELDNLVTSISRINYQPISHEQTSPHQT